MGSVVLTHSNMKAVLFSLLFAAVSCDQTHHQAIKLGNAPSVSHAVHKPHGAYHASVSSQPHAAPQSVHGYGGYEKKVTAVHAPAAVPSYHAAPVYHAPAVHHAAPVYHTPAVHHASSYHAAPSYHARPVVHHAAPVVHHAAPSYHAVAKPAYHAPVHHAASYKEPAYDGPAVYAYEYAVADDYSGAKFHAGESRDGYATTGSYSVALPDGRTQTVNYKVADDYSGYVADVQYSGEPHYAAAPAYKPATAYKPAPVYHA